MTPPTATDPLQAALIAALDATGVWWSAASRAEQMLAHPAIVAALDAIRAEAAAVGVWQDVPELHYWTGARGYISIGIQRRDLGKLLQRIEAAAADRESARWREAMTKALDGWERVDMHCDLLVRTEWPCEDEAQIAELRALLATPEPTP